MAELLRANGGRTKVFPIDPERNNGFSISELRGFVRGDFEILYLDQHQCLVCHDVLSEDYNSLDFNQAATDIFSDSPEFVFGWKVNGDALIASIPAEIPHVPDRPNQRYLREHGGA